MIAVVSHWPPGGYVFDNRFFPCFRRISHTSHPQLDPDISATMSTHHDDIGQDDPSIDEVETTTVDNKPIPMLVTSFSKRPVTPSMLFQLLHYPDEVRNLVYEWTLTCSTGLVAEVHNTQNGNTNRIILCKGLSLSDPFGHKVEFNQLKYGSKQLWREIAGSAIS